MRTTLKRGIGRATGADGNGRAMLPPGSLTPVARYRQPPPPPRNRWTVAWHLLVWGVAVLAMVAVALVGGAYLWLHESVAATHPHSQDVKDAQRYVDDVPPPGKAAVALVLGYDHRFAESATTPSRSDTMMLLRADPQTKTISMLSFPRDMSVTVHCPGGSVFHAKINAAYANCGSKGAIETVKALTGLPINYLITVDFGGFMRVVNTLGGVWIDVDHRYFNDNHGLGSFTYAKINLLPGYQRLTGGSALAYVRFRHTDSDFYRVARQQLFVTAMKEQFQKHFSKLKVPKLVNTVSHNVEIAVGGGKELSLGKVLSYALFAYRLPAGHFFQARIDGLTGSSSLYTSDSNVEQAVQNFVSPDVAAPKVATAVALNRKLKSVAPKPEQTTAVVLNGNNVLGSAANAKYLLAQRSYRMLELPSGATGNAPSFDYDHTVVYYDPSQPGAQAAARGLAKLLAPADVAKVPAIIKPLSSGAMVTVVVGTTFHNRLVPPAPSTEIVHEAPRVVTNRDETESLVRSARSKVGFPLMVPTVLEANSIPDPEVPIRAYHLDEDHRAVRMTFRTGGRQYWGIEMTDWQDAPVFDDRSSRHVLGGRHFDFYYHGSHLHMIVLREKGVTYWVVNSLLDGLSNETMIAVARGLQPLDLPAKKRAGRSPVETRRK